MKNKKIGNPEKMVPETEEMNDKDYLNVVLELEKNMSNNYSVALNEASNEHLYSEYFDLFEDTKDAAREVYETMFEAGWYQLEEATTDKINEAITKMEKQLHQLPE